MELIMRKVMFAAASAAAIAMSLATAAPAAAQVAGPRIAAGAQPAAQSPSAGITQVRWRGHRHWHGGYWHRGRWHRGYWYGDGAGAAVAAGIAGLAIGGALAAQAQSQNSVAYCEQRFRSYDPASGTYLGYDGYRHPCP
jgi:hypothetical protein